MAEQTAITTSPAVVHHRWRFAVVLLASLLLAVLMAAMFA
jgi:hypothetical protein